MYLSIIIYVSVFYVFMHNYICERILCIMHNYICERILCIYA